MVFTIQSAASHPYCLAICFQLLCLLTQDNPCQFLSRLPNLSSRQNASCKSTCVVQRWRRRPRSGKGSCQGDQCAEIGITGSKVDDQRCRFIPPAAAIKALRARPSGRRGRADEGFLFPTHITVLCSCIVLISMLELRSEGLARLRVPCINCSAETGLSDLSEGVFVGNNAKHKQGDIVSLGNSKYLFLIEAERQIHVAWSSNKKWWFYPRMENHFCGRFFRPDDRKWGAVREGVGENQTAALNTDIIRWRGSSIPDFQADSWKFPNLKVSKPDSFSPYIGAQLSLCCEILGAPLTARNPRAGTSMKRRERPCISACDYQKT